MDSSDVPFKLSSRRIEWFQVEELLDHIFFRRRDLIRSHGRAVAGIVKKLQFCPASAVETIKLLAASAAKGTESGTNFLTSYALTLILLSYVDVMSSKVVTELPEIVSLRIVEILDQYH